MRYCSFRNLALLVSSFAFFHFAEASDGRIEINQASVEAAGGFPYTISEPGSYVLTGPLVVPASTDGLVIETNFVTIDLNGFSITSSAVCVRTNCDSGSGEGVRSSIARGTVAHSTTIKNGTIRGFASNCVRLGTASQIEKMRVANCGGSGVDLGSQSNITQTVIRQTGQYGLTTDDTTTYSHNNVTEPALGGGGEFAVEGGTATGGNLCIGSEGCSWVDTRRRFYVTLESTIDGNEALGACESGFHMASLWEILDITQLRYDTTRGAVSDDVGSGPNSFHGGWVRTGYAGLSGNPNPGHANCNGWTTESDAGWGTIARLVSYWQDDVEILSYPGNFRTDWWASATATCDTNQRVWCVEN